MLKEWSEMVGRVLTECGISYRAKINDNAAFYFAKAGKNCLNLRVSHTGESRVWIMSQSAISPEKRLQIFEELNLFSCIHPELKTTIEDDHVFISRAFCLGCGNDPERIAGVISSFLNVVRA